MADAGSEDDDDDVEDEEEEEESEVIACATKAALRINKRKNQEPVTVTTQRVLHDLS